MTLSANIEFYNGRVRLNGCRKFLFEILPDIFYQGFLTQTEIELWAKYTNYMDSLNNGNN